MQIKKRVNSAVASPLNAASPSPLNESIPRGLKGLVPLLSLLSFPFFSLWEPDIKDQDIVKQLRIKGKLESDHPC